jgi:diaminopimelate decarboxylase
MDHFAYRNRALYCEDVAIADIAATYGTPVFVYSQATMLHHLNEIQTAFSEAKPIICYSIKANGNISLARLMGQHGAGYDVTSGGEYYRALRAAGISDVGFRMSESNSTTDRLSEIRNPKSEMSPKIVFAGVGKTNSEIEFALKNGVYLFDVESEEELHTIGAVAKEMGVRAAVALRVNPDLPPKTHAKTDTSVKGVKFGLDIETVLEVAEKVVKHPGLAVKGIHMHLGSPILKAEPYKQGSDKAVTLVNALRKQGHEISILNMGGGFGIHYRKDEALPASAFAAAILPAVRETGCQLVLEPGRFIVGNAGVLVSTVLFNKETGGKKYVIQDAAMNDLIRPTLYGSFHRIWPVALPNGLPDAPPVDMTIDPDTGNPFVKIDGTQTTQVVGPVCESGDFLAKDRPLPVLTRGQLLATFSAGAYGMSMSSNYNARCRAAEVLVTGGTHRLIRRRETYADLVACEEDCLS